MKRIALSLLALVGACASHVTPDAGVLGRRSNGAALKINGVFDDETHIRYDGKGIRMVNGARLLQRAPSLFDHFVAGAGAFNSQVPQNWVTTETGAATAYAVGATGATVAIGATGGTTNNAEELAGKLVGWKPSTMATNTRLVFETRLKFVGTTTPADGDMVFGLADAVTYTNGLPFVVGASSLYTTTAPVEFAGFHYSSIPTSGTLFAASGNNYIGMATEISSSAALAKSTAIQKDSSFHIYRVEINSVGDAFFFIDDVAVGVTLLAVTAATALTPYFSGIAKASHVLTVTIDYIWVGGDTV